MAVRSGWRPPRPVGFHRVTPERGRLLVVDLAQRTLVAGDDTLAHVVFPATRWYGPRRGTAVGRRSHDGSHRWVIRRRPRPDHPFGRALSR